MALSNNRFLPAASTTFAPRCAVVVFNPHLDKSLRSDIKKKGRFDIGLFHAPNIPQRKPQCCLITLTS